MSYETLLYAVAGDVAAVTLNRPERMNSLNAVMRAELPDALTRAPREARAGGLAGAGRVRYRGVSPWALVADREPAARELAAALAEARKRLAQRVRSVTQGQVKLAIVDDLIEMLSGTGGDPDLLRRIDELSE